MKTLYVNINNEELQSIKDFEVLNYSLLDDFFYYLGDAIVGDSQIYVDNKINLIKDFETSDNASEFKKILNQWDDFKVLLFGNQLEEVYEVSIPNGYIDWLHYNNKFIYQKLYDLKYKSQSEIKINIDVKSFYEECFHSMKSKILSVLLKDDLYKRLDFLVFGEKNVNSKFELFVDINALNKDILSLTLDEWHFFEGMEKDNEIKFKNLEFENNRNFRLIIDSIIHGNVYETFNYIDREWSNLKNKMDEHICSYVNIYYGNFFYSYFDRLTKYLTYEEMKKIGDRIHEGLLPCLSIVELSSSTCREFKMFLLEEAKKQNSELYQNLINALKVDYVPEHLLYSQVANVIYGSDYHYYWVRNYFCNLMVSAFRAKKAMYKMNFWELVKSVKTM